MKYLCLAYEEERIFSEMTKAQWHTLLQETLDYVAELQRQNKLVLTNALQSATKAHSLKIREGELTVTDGPFAETKEQLGGFFLIDVASEEEALEIAAGWPSARLGIIEVRPVEDELRPEGRY